MSFENLVVTEWVFWKSLKVVEFENKIQGIKVHEFAKSCKSIEALGKS